MPTCRAHVALGRARGAPPPCPPGGAAAVLAALGAAGRPGKARRYACLLKINVLDGGWALRDGRDVPATPIKGLASENNASPVHSQKILDDSLHTESWGTFDLGVSIRRIHNK